jgi:hypothetical protein
MAKEFHHNERSQKEMYAEMNMPCSPVREPRVFPPLSHIENPWENSRSYVPVNAIEEEDRGDSGSHHDDDETKEEEEEVMLVKMRMMRRKKMRWPSTRTRTRYPFLVRVAKGGVNLVIGGPYLSYLSLYLSNA